MNCKYCNAELPEDSRYCPVCGSKLSAAAAAETAPKPEAMESDSTFRGKHTEEVSVCNAHGENTGTTADRTADQPLKEAKREGTTDSGAAENCVPQGTEQKHSVFSYFSRAHMALAVMLCCAILVGAGSCIYCLGHTRSLEGQLRRANSDKQTAEATIEELNSQLSDAQTELEMLQGENETLSGQVSSLTSQVTTLEGDITQYQYDASAAEQDAEYAAGQITTLNDTVTGLETDLAAANETNETLQSDNDTLTEENGTLQTENETLTEENKAYEEKVAFYDQYVVFVTVGDKNKYYHTYDCTDFTKKNFLAYSVKLAEQNGYSPCPVCHPETAAAVTAKTTAGNN